MELHNKNNISDNAPDDENRVATANGKEPLSLPMKTNKWKHGYISIAIVSISLITVKLISVELPPGFFISSGRSITSKAPKLAELHLGDPVEQIFTARVRVPGCKPGDRVVFKVVALHWRQPFFFPANVVENGYAVCDFSVGCIQDTGKVYEITGIRLSPNVSIPSGEQPEGQVLGDTVFGPSLHRRL